MDGDETPDATQTPAAAPEKYPQISTIKPLGIGTQSESVNTNPLIGIDVDVIRLWSSVRTATEVTDHFRTPLDPNTEQDLIGLWRFNELNGPVSFFLNEICISKI